MLPAPRPIDVIALAVTLVFVFSVVWYAELLYVNWSFRFELSIGGVQISKSSS